MKSKFQTDEAIPQFIFSSESVSEHKVSDLQDVCAKTKSNSGRVAKPNKQGSQLDWQLPVQQSSRLKAKKTP